MRVGAGRAAVRRTSLRSPYTRRVPPVLFSADVVCSPRADARLQPAPAPLECYAEAATPLAPVVAGVRKACRGGADEPWPPLDDDEWRR